MDKNQFTKKQHLIPQFWVKKWESNVNGERVIYAINDGFKEPFVIRITTKNHLSHDESIFDCYTYENTLSRENSVEHGLSRIETGASKAISIIENYFISNFSSEEISIVDIFFVVTLIFSAFYRSEYIRSFFKNPESPFAMMSFDEGSQLNFFDLFSLKLKLHLELMLKLSAKYKYESGKKLAFSGKIPTIENTFNISDNHVSTLDDLLNKYNQHFYYSYSFKAVKFLWISDDIDMTFLFNNLTLSINSYSKNCKEFSERIKTEFLMKEQDELFITALTPRILCILAYPSETEKKMEIIEARFNPETQFNNVHITFDFISDPNFIREYNRLVVDISKKNDKNIVLYQNHIDI
ncbi:MAG: DUF4238 domain-containing protein [Mycoplasma sp.]